jgi:hypothetical protein
MYHLKQKNQKFKTAEKKPKKKNYRLKKKIARAFVQCQAVVGLTNYYFQSAIEHYFFFLTPTAFLFFNGFFSEVGLKFFVGEYVVTVQLNVGWLMV